MRFTPITRSTILRAALGAVALLLVAAGCESPQATSFEQRRGGQYHQVVGVVSGDTFVGDLRLDGGTHRLNVKLIGVKAPVQDAHVAEWGAQTATDLLGRALARGWVRIEFNNQLNEPLRHYDGTLVADQEAYVFVPPADTDRGGHETFVNREMLEQGYVVRDTGIARDDRGALGEYVDRMDEAQSRARNAARGVWALPR